MVIIRTSAVEVSIQAVSPLSSFGATVAAVWAIADRLQAAAKAAAHNRHRTRRYAKLIPDLPETRSGRASLRRPDSSPRSCDAGKRNPAFRRAAPHQTT